MPRPPRPERKQELMHDILLYLQDKSIADLSFRTLADGLGISSFVLVYHFGSREELISEIVRSIEQRPAGLVNPELEKSSREELAAWLTTHWESGQRSYGRELQRLGYEAAMHDLVLTEPRGKAPEVYTDWVAFFNVWFVNQGVPTQRAAVLARLFMGALNGLHYDYVLTRDREGSTHAFEALLESLNVVLDHETSKS